MKKPEIPIDEALRLENLSTYNILDTEAENDFDQLTQLASDICGTSMSLVSLIESERQWFKSKVGISADETPREFTFCAHAINSPEELLEVCDAREDIRFHDNPLVLEDPNVIFYAGIPLVSKEGYALGTICVADSAPKKLNDFQKGALKTIADQLMRLMELRLRNDSLIKTNTDLEINNTEIEKFAYRAAHDLKSPINNITAIVNHIQKGVNVSVKEQLEIVKSSSNKLGVLINDLLQYSKDTRFRKEKKKLLIQDIVKDVEDILTYDSNNFSIKVSSDCEFFMINETSLRLILRNTFSNTIRYSDKDNVLIEVILTETPKHYTLEIKDNGPGIPEKYFDRIFEPFESLHSSDKYGKKGNGLGLHGVKSIIDNMNGKVSVNSTEGVGTSFIFELTKD